MYVIISSQRSSTNLSLYIFQLYYLSLGVYLFVMGIGSSRMKEDPISIRTNAMAPFLLLLFEHLHSCRLSTMSGKPLNIDREQKRHLWSPQVALTVLNLNQNSLQLRGTREELVLYTQVFL
jgi:hypothetical protein